MNYTALIMGVTFVVALIVQMVYFLKDDAAPEHTEQDRKLEIGWHLAGGALHVWGAVMVSLISSFHYGLLVASLTWLFFDGFVNTFVFKKGWYYIGNTAALDRTIRWLCRRRNVYWVNPEAAAGILKILFVVGSIIWLIVKIKA